MSGKKNDLNLKLQSEVITLVGTLDIKKTLANINKQITEINKNTDALKKVKLDVKLNLTVTNLNAQIKKFQTMLDSSKSFKPLKLDVKVNLEGASKDLKTKLGMVENEFNNFNKTLKANAKKVKENTGEINTAIKGLKLKDGLGNISVEASKFGKEVDKIKKDVYKMSGGKGAGLFSFKEVKDGQGNLKGLTATLTRTNGIVNQMHYDWNSDSKKLIPVSQVTVNENEKNVKQAIASLKKLEKEMHRLQNGVAKTKLFKDFAKLDKQGINGTIKMDSVKAIEERIRKESILQGVVQKTDTMSAKSIRTLDNMQKSINRLGEGAGKDKLIKEFEKLSKQANMTKTDVANMNKAISSEKEMQEQIAKENGLLEKQAKLIKDVKIARQQALKDNKDVDVSAYNQVIKNTKSDYDLKNLKEQREVLNDLNRINKTKVKDEEKSFTNKKKALQIAKELRALEKKAGNDAYSLNLIKEISLMKQRAKTTEDWFKIQEKMDKLRISNDNIKLNQDTMNLEAQAQKRLTQLKNLGKLTEEQYTKSIHNLSRVTASGFTNLDNYYQALGRRIERANNEIKRTADRSKVLLDGSAVNGVSNTSNIKSAVDTGDINSLQKYIGELYKVRVETIKVEQGTDKFGRAVDRLKVQFAGTGKTVQTATLEYNRLNQALTQVAQGSTYNANRNLGVFEQLKIAMARVPVWMVAMTAFYSSIQAVSSAVNKIIEIDTLMTNIARVSGDNLNLNAMFEGSVKLSAELGNNLSDILTSLGEFSRTFGEFNERQLLAITRTATLMSNVSELTAQEATQNLVGTMNAFNIEAEESIRIVDALNEVNL